jgi:hypothetical protein
MNDKNLFSKNADPELVRQDPEAIRYHAVKFHSGHRYPLAALCVHWLQQEQREEDTQH